MWSLKLIRLSESTFAAVLVLGACDSSSSALRFPAGTPGWVRRDAVGLAKGLGDSHPTSVWIKRGRYTLIVVTGRFTCRTCSHPFVSGNYRPPRGTFAATRLDSNTHAGVDFALCHDRATCVSSLCDGGCTIAKYALDSAFSTLYAHTGKQGEVDFDRKTGFHRNCGLRDPASEYGVIKGNCRVTEVAGPARIVVTFTETWRGLDRSGRRTAAGPLRRHIWRVAESPSGWMWHFFSSGAAPPQFEPCRRSRVGPAIGLSCPKPLR
jgi:hypothetical protein